MPPLLWNEFLIESDRRIRLDDLHVSRTYASLLEGTPDDAYNTALIERAETALNGTWGPRPTYVVPPQPSVCTEIPWRPYPRLPELRYHARLTSNPLKPQWSTSELVLIWFGSSKEFREKALIEIVASAASNLEWERWAKDFDY